VETNSGEAFAAEPPRAWAADRFERKNGSLGRFFFEFRDNMLTALQTTIARITASLDGLVGVCVRDIESGEEIGVRLDEALPMASVCKIPILVAAYREHEAGRLDLNERIPITEETRCFGSGLFNHFDLGIEPTIHDLLLMMIVVSDNLATDLVLDRIGAERVTEIMRDLGLGGIRVDRPIRGLIGDILAALDPRLAGIRYGEWDALKEQYPDLEAKDKDLVEGRRAVNEAASDRDTATPRAIARLCAQIAENKCATEESCEAMLDILDEQQLNGRLPRDLPAFTRFPHKTGTLGSGAVVNDAGVLFLEDKPVASVCVLSRDVKNPIHETNSAIAAIGRAVYDYYKAKQGA
jgi:beta-lactamase class A